MEKTVHTYCRVCEPNCGIIATVKDGRLVKVQGDPAHPVSKGYICRRGRATLDVHLDPDRLDYPLRKKGEEWKRADYNEAVKDIGARIRAIRKKHGDNAVALYFGNPVAFDFSFGLYLPIAMMSMRSRNFYSSGSQDCNNKFVGARAVFGSPVLHPVPDVENIDFLILMGSNPAVSQSSFISLARPIERLRNIEKRGGRVIVVDPRYTETAKMVGEHVPIRPDSDAFLLMAMLNVIIGEGLFDRDKVKRTCRGLDELERFTGKWTPASAEKITGIPADKIAGLARDFAAAKNAGIHASLGLNLGSFGTLCYWLVQCLNAVTGRLDQRGSMVFPEGLIDFASLYSRTPKRVSVGKNSRVGGYPSVLGTWPAGVMADEMLTPGPGQVKALIVVAGNPMLTVQDPRKLEKAMKGLELTVSLDLYRNETAELCEYVFPCTDMYERWDFGMIALNFNPLRHINYTEAAVKPKAERRDTWRIMHDIIRASGYDFGGNKALSITAGLLDGAAKALGRPGPWSFSPHLMMRAQLLAGKRSWQSLKDGPQGLLLGEHLVGRFFSGRIRTPDGKANLAPEPFIGSASELDEFYRREKDAAGFQLIGLRQRITHNSWFHNAESLVKDVLTNKAILNPEDADALKINDGDIVRVSTDFGSIELPATVSEEVPPGVVAVPHGWGHGIKSGLSAAKKRPGVNVNLLLPSGPGTMEKLAGMAKMTGVRVKIEKAS